MSAPSFVQEVYTGAQDSQSFVQGTVLAGASIALDSKAKPDFFNVSQIKDITI